MSTEVTIRWAGREDSAAITALAALESRTVPTAPMLVAERDGTIIAALAVGTGEPALADPFSRTGELVSLLELRAGQLREAERSHRRRGLRRLRPAHLH